MMPFLRQWMDNGRYAHGVESCAVQQRRSNGRSRMGPCTSHVKGVHIRQTMLCSPYMAEQGLP